MLLWKGSNPGGRGERGLICEASILFWREIGSPPKLGRWHSLVVSNGGSIRLTTTKTTSTLGCILNAKKSMLSEQAVKSWPLEKYAKFVAPKETSSTHKQGYWKVCMLRIFKSKNLLCRRGPCGFRPFDFDSKLKIENQKFPIVIFNVWFLKNWKSQIYNLNRQFLFLRNIKLKNNFQCFENQKLKIENGQLVVFISCF